MNETTRKLIQSTFEASDAGSLHFGEVVQRLANVQVESYHVDFRSGRCTCHLQSGETVDHEVQRPLQAIAGALDADALRSAIRGAQQGRVKYPEFRQLSQHAGCAGYSVWIAGRHVSYFGRKGEMHIERFPD